MAPDAPARQQVRLMIHLQDILRWRRRWIRVLAAMATRDAAEWDFE